MHTRSRRTPLLLLPTVLAGALVSRPAQAIPPGETTPGQTAALRCLGGVQASIRATPDTIALGQTTTVSWNAKTPNGCSGLKYYFGPTVVGRSGMTTDRPLSNARYALRATFNGASAEVAVAGVQVVLPRVLTITDGTVPNVRWQMVQALGTPGSTVILGNGVDLDLTGMHDIAVAEGVTFRGGRTSREPGARLFATARTPVLFNVTGDNVRITGLRIEGPEMGVSEADDYSRGILVESRVNVQIDHNELSGWSTMAVLVQDAAGRVDPAVNPNAIRIHDNYIHHNQHLGGNGYGVSVKYGAFAQIVHNVFDWNRHAIEGDGRSGTGYDATGNLVLPNGGLHRWIPFPGTWVHTHQFDMHAMGNCGIADLWSDSLWNCGLAGGVMYIRQNTFLYTNGPAIKLRGTPEVGMFVGGNVFKAPFLLTKCTGSACVSGTVRQNESGLVIEPGNQVGVDGSSQLGACDFDGDGANDAFMATGATWWFASGGTRPWTYLNTSTKTAGQVVLGYFDGDNRCDVAVDGVVYSGGTTLQITYWAQRLGSTVALAR